MPHAVVGKSLPLETSSGSSCSSGDTRHNGSQGKGGGEARVRVSMWTGTAGSVSGSSMMMTPARGMVVAVGGDGEDGAVTGELTDASMEMSDMSRTRRRRR